MQPGEVHRPLVSAHSVAAHQRPRKKYVLGADENRVFFQVVGPSRLFHALGSSRQEVHRDLVFARHTCDREALQPSLALCSVCSASARIGRQYTSRRGIVSVSWVTSRRPSRQPRFHSHASATAAVFPMSGNVQQFRPWLFRKAALIRERPKAVWLLISTCRALEEVCVGHRSFPSDGIDESAGACSPLAIRSTGSIASISVSSGAALRSRRRRAETSTRDSSVTTDLL